ncbi:MAG: hypothetical protein R3A48_04720 [Polyangiales bacterium]
MDSSWTTGARIAGRYELVAPISDAGITEAWSARDAHGGEFRVSVLGPTTPALDSLLPGTQERVRALSNPGIVTPLELSSAEGVCFVASEPFDGRPLANWLEGHRQADTRPGFGVVQRLFDRLAAALISAHTAGVVHGALSPRCVLLKRVGQGQHHLRVCDLSLGPFTVQSASTPSWFEYQAPEQKGPRAEDPASVDVFAAAVILVEMLTLAAGPRADAREPWGPFVREAKGAAVVDRLVSLRGDVPRPVWEVVAGALSTSVRERGTLQKLQRALRETWTAVGEWDRSALAEPDPPAPDPSRVGARASMPTSQPKPRGADGIEGWQSAERAAAPAPPPRAPLRPAPPSMPAAPPAPPPPAASSLRPQPRDTALTPLRPSAPSHDPPEATEAIDLHAAELYLAQMRDASATVRTPPRRAAAPAPAPEEREHTKAIDASALFEGSLSHGDSLDDSAGTAVLAQGGGIAAAIAAADRDRVESTRMLDLAPPMATPLAAADPSAWDVGAPSVPDPYVRHDASSYGSDDPFADPRSSIPGYGGQTEAWAAATPLAPSGGTPFNSTLKAIPRSSLPTPSLAPSAPSTPEKLWGAAPAPAPPPPVAPEQSGVPAWQWGVLLAAILGVGAAMYLALTSR